jgi:hypothetical protein
MSDRHPKNQESVPGAEPDRLKIEGDWTEAIREAMKVPRPASGFPDHRKRERKGKKENGDG